ncbi:hypothetical protein ACWDWV_12615 [Streptosporangium sandarakinum]
MQVRAQRPQVGLQVGLQVVALPAQFDSAGVADLSGGMRALQGLAALLRLGACLVALVLGGGQLPAQVVGRALAVAPDLGGLGCHRLRPCHTIHV